MLTYNDAFYQLKNKLLAVYDERESVSIAHELLHHITGLEKMDRLLKKDSEFDGKQQQLYEQAAADLLSGRPIQYIIGTAWFMGKEYKVNEHVLIPRPETEELIQWILDDLKPQAAKDKIRLLDIGTGSGCIAISLKLAMPNADLTSCDISFEALEIAKENADKLGVDVQFLQLDFLDQSQQMNLSAYDIIVSNPPYIPITEKEKMHANVKDHEPGIALFVPGDDALLFYKAIAEFGKTHLHRHGFIYCELETNHAMACKTLFENNGYTKVDIRKDMHGNWRMLKAGFQ